MMTLEEFGRGLLDIIQKDMLGSFLMEYPGRVDLVLWNLQRAINFLEANSKHELEVLKMLVDLESDPNVTVEDFTPPYEKLAVVNLEGKKSLVSWYDLPGSINSAFVDLFMPGEEFGIREIEEGIMTDVMPYLLFLSSIDTVWLQAERRDDKIVLSIGDIEEVEFDV